MTNNSNTYKTRCGPGHWDLIHRHAAKSTSQNRKEFMIDLLDMESISFGCKDCRNDFSEVWSRYKNNLRKYWTIHVKHKNDTIDCGLLILTIDIHNEVNRKLNKPTMDYRDAILMYAIEFTEEESCQDICID